MEFTAEQLTRHAVGPDSLRRWTVTLPGVRYVGKVLAPAEWTHAEVATRLHEWASRTSPQIVAARIYSPVRIHEV